MSDGFVGEIRAFAFGVVPRGWMPCNGQLLPIRQNQALFSLLGATYGGDGKTTFALPNLQGRLVMGSGPDVALGQLGGEPAHTLVPAELPPHVHAAMGSTSPAAKVPPGPSVALARTEGGPLYAPPGQVRAMSPDAIGPAGESKPHENMMPYLVLNVCIAVDGMFPSA
jgi:microcystin-dependent protein